MRRAAAHLGEVAADEMDDATRIDLIRALEELKCAAEATQAELAATLSSDRADDRGVASQVALARRESPHRGRQHLSLARIVRAELPHTRAAFRAGRISEWRATIIARETACLSREDRTAVDRAIAGDPEALESYSDRVLLGELRKLAGRLDPAAVAERRRRAETERRVTSRPAPDTMGYLTLLAPVAHVVGCVAALTRAADSAMAEGDPRSRSQLMADLLVERVTGADSRHADPSDDRGPRPVLPVSLGLVMSAASLFGRADDTAHLTGFGPVPAGLARELVADHLDLLDRDTRLWLRHLFTSPETGELVAMDSTQRLFRGQLREFLTLRDQFCRTPWCNAPIRHADHVAGAAQGGDTSADDGQGLCATCNYAKAAPGWRARPSPGPDPGHTVAITTPTGHTYRSQAPPLVGLRVGAYQQVDEGRWHLIA